MHFSRLLFSGKKIPATFWLVFLLSTQPVFILVIKGWGSGVLILGALASMVFLGISRKDSSVVGHAHSESLSHWFVLAFASWIMTTSVAGLFRGHLDIGLLDSPSRFLLAIPVFYFVRRWGEDALRILIVAVALAPLATLLHQIFSSHASDWSSSRMSNYFADPLAFGYICLSMAFMNAAALFHRPRQSPYLTFLKVLGLCVGIYLSIRTESRTGWLAIPLVLLSLLYFQAGKIHIRNVALGLVVLASVAGIGYKLSPIVKDRIDITWSDVESYSFNGIAKDTSIGLRITFLRMALDMLSEHPLAGYGDTQKVHPVVPEVINQYASTYARDFAISAGFHNEVVTNGVQSGMSAMLAILLIFSVPALIYGKAMKSIKQTQRIAGLMGFVFTLTILVSSLSTEVFGLKYTASYYALLTALFCGICLQPASEENL